MRCPECLQEGFHKMSCDSQTSLTDLTKTEWEIVQMLADGLQIKEIAKQRCVSPRTVDTHVSNIHEKLGTHTIGAIVAHGFRHNKVS